MPRTTQFLCVSIEYYFHLAASLSKMVSQFVVTFWEGGSLINLLYSLMVVSKPRTPYGHLLPNTSVVHVFTKMRTLGDDEFP